MSDRRFLTDPTYAKKILMRERRPICETPGCGTITIDLHLDHIVPLIEDGAFDRSNLQLLCVPCHKKKTAAEATERARRRRSH